MGSAFQSFSLAFLKIARSFSSPINCFGDSLCASIEHTDVPANDFGAEANEKEIDAAAQKAIPDCKVRRKWCTDITELYESLRKL